MNITQEQEQALRMIYEKRGTLWIQNDNDEQTTSFEGLGKGDPLTFEQFKERAQPTFGMCKAIAIAWCGMWLLIETDGYTHS